MSAAVAIPLAAQLLLTALEVYKLHAGKPKGWVPNGPADWDELEVWANRTPEDIKRDALKNLPQRRD